MRNQTRHLTFGVSLLMVLVCTLLLSVPALADGPKKNISDDDVNAVARKLFCPVCENIPLDVCGTQACAQWRAEIRTQLEAGRDPQEVITDFVNRYGDRVVGTPQDPTLRALSLITPWVLSALIVGVAVALFVRWRNEQRRAGSAGSVGSEANLALATDSNSSATPRKPLDEYRARIERDLKQRR